MSKPIRATARVRITIEIGPDDTWGSDCTVEQIMKQAKESALGRLDKLMHGTLPRDRHPQEFRIVAAPEVTAVLVDGGEA
jgi:hypothetical protein